MQTYKPRQWRQGRLTYHRAASVPALILFSCSCVSLNRSAVRHHCSSSPSGTARKAHTGCLTAPQHTHLISGQGGRAKLRVKRRGERAAHGAPGRKIGTKVEPKKNHDDGCVIHCETAGAPRWNTISSGRGEGECFYRCLVLFAAKQSRTSKAHEGVISQSAGGRERGVLSHAREEEREEIQVPSASMRGVRKPRCSAACPTAQHLLCAGSV